MNRKVKRKRIFIVLTCTLSTLLIAIISATPMYLHECEVKPVADRQRDVQPEPTFNDLLDAMIEVESNGNEIAIGVGGERGILQLSEIYIDDVNRIRGASLATGRDIYEYEDAFDPLLSRIMAKTYLKYYLNYAAKDKPLEMHSFEMAARIHNGGPQGWKLESTKEYWEKVKARMESQ